MSKANMDEIAAAKHAATEVLLHNMTGPFDGLPRTAGWGYPEPYTRDLMLAMLGIAVSGEDQLWQSSKVVLETLAKNQTELGLIPSLVHEPGNLGASDTTPLFLMGVGIYRKQTGDQTFLRAATEKSLTWLRYQSPAGNYLIAQLPTSDWRDEQWVLGYGLYVNVVFYCALRLLGHDQWAKNLRDAIHRFKITKGNLRQREYEGIVIAHTPYYALWSYKIYSSNRFDLLGNSLAIISGMASQSRAHDTITWVEKECSAMRDRGELCLDLPPNFFPFIQVGDDDWIERYALHNKAGEYHNGGVWPFICALYVVALVANGRHALARKKLVALTKLVKGSQHKELEFGFNEWVKPADGKPAGQDWQTWSAAMYLYAAKCVEQQRPLFLG